MALWPLPTHSTYTQYLLGHTRSGRQYWPEALITEVQNSPALQVGPSSTADVKNTADLLPTPLGRVGFSRMIDPTGYIQAARQERYGPCPSAYLLTESAELHRHRAAECGFSRPTSQ